MAQDLDFDYESHLKRMAHKDHHSLHALYEHEAASMFSLSHQLLGTAHEAERLLRTTFVLLWQHAASYDPELGAARAWIYSILRHRARQMRKLRVQTRARQAADPIDTGQHAKNALDLAYLNGLDYNAIARCKGISPSQAQHELRYYLRQHAPGLAL